MTAPSVQIDGGFWGVLLLALIIGGFLLVASRFLPTSRASGGGVRAPIPPATPPTASSASSGGGKFQMPSAGVIAAVVLGILAIIVIFVFLIPWWNSEGPQRTWQRAQEETRKVVPDLPRQVESAPMPVASVEDGDFKPVGESGTLPAVESGEWVPIPRVRGWRNCVELPADEFTVRRKDGLDWLQSTGAARDYHLYRVRKKRSCRPY